MAIDSLPPWIWPRAAYVHVPFCAHHCGYCDFAVAAGQDHLQEAYLEALEAEIATLGDPVEVRTCFLGGGTPTHMRVEGLERLLGVLRQWLPLSAGGEFTIEANPESLTEEKVAVLVAYGVTRVSLGAQSFQGQVLQVLERAHDPDAILPAVERARSAGMQVSLDLIFGVPGQTVMQWGSDLEVALGVRPDHLSTYGLTYEKGTRLWKSRARGTLRPLDEESELRMYQLAIERAGAAGYEHYEISNFALPGRRCRHNETYWANEAYFGFGLGAARYVHGVREVNTRDLQGYVRRARAGQAVTQQSEQLDVRERARETMAVQLRRIDGIERARFLEQTSLALDDVAGDRLAWLVEQGFLSDDGQRVALTAAGKPVADAVIERLL